MIPVFNAAVKGRGIAGDSEGNGDPIYNPVASTASRIL